MDSWPLLGAPVGIGISFELIIKNTRIKIALLWVTLHKNSSSIIKDKYYNRVYH